MTMTFHNPPDYDTFEHKFRPIPQHDLGRVITVDDDPFPPAPGHRRANGSWLGQHPALEQRRPIRQRHKAHFTITERRLMTYAWILAALALVALMVIALMAGRPHTAGPLEQLPTAPTSSSWSPPVAPAGAVGSLPDPSPLPTN